MPVRRLSARHGEFGTTPEARHDSIIWVGYGEANTKCPRGPVDIRVDHRRLGNDTEVGGLLQDDFDLLTLLDLGEHGRRRNHVGIDGIDLSNRERAPVLDVLAGRDMAIHDNAVEWADNPAQCQSGLDALDVEGLEAKQLLL